MERLFALLLAMRVSLGVAAMEPGVAPVTLMTESSHAQVLTRGSVSEWVGTGADYTNVIANEWDVTSEALRVFTNALVAAELGDVKHQSAAQKANESARLLLMPEVVRQSARAVRAAADAISTTSPAATLESQISSVATKEISRMLAQVSAAGTADMEAPMETSFLETHSSSQARLARPSVGSQVTERASGRRGTVIQDDHDHKPYRVHFADGDTSDFLRESDVEAMPSAKPSHAKVVAVAATGTSPAQVLTSRDVTPFSLAMAAFASDLAKQSRELDALWKDIVTALQRTNTTGVFALDVQKLESESMEAASNAEALRNASQALADLGTVDVGGSFAEGVKIDPADAPAVYQVSSVIALSPLATKDMAQAASALAAQTAREDRYAAKALHEAYDRFKWLLEQGTDEQKEKIGDVESTVKPLAQRASKVEAASAAAARAFASASAALGELARPTSPSVSTGSAEQEASSQVNMMAQGSIASRLGDRVHEAAVVVPHATTELLRREGPSRAAPRRSP